MIGSLLYVTASWPHVMQAIGQVARIQAAPKESHIIFIKWILLYLKGTIEYGLWYPKGNNINIQAFTDADWEGCIDDCKSNHEAFVLHHFLVILPIIIRWTQIHHVRPILPIAFTMWNNLVKHLY